MTDGSGFENSPMQPTAVVIITTFRLFRRYSRCPFAQPSNERYSNPGVIAIDELSDCPSGKSGGITVTAPCEPVDRRSLSSRSPAGLSPRMASAARATTRSEATLVPNAANQFLAPEDSFEGA